MRASRIFDEQPVIVVAVDGSAESTAALAWADRHAARIGASLKVVSAYRPSASSVDAVGAQIDSFDKARRQWRKRARDVMVEVLGAERAAWTPHIVAMGPILPLLIRQSQGARMIVVGTRNTNGVLSRLRGSLTNRLTGKVQCPVVSISADAEAREMVAA